MASGHRRTGLLTLGEFKDKGGVRSDKIGQKVQIVGREALDIKPFDSREIAFRVIKAKIDRTLDGNANRAVIPRLRVCELRAVIKLYITPQHDPPFVMI